MTKDNYIAVYIHFVWATKNFENVLDKSVRYKLFDHIYKDANLKGIKVKIVNGVENHIHCLVSMLTTQTIAEVAKQLKGESSHWFNENNPNHYQKLVWQNGYGAISVSPQAFKKVYNYIYKQEEHHKSQSFEEEWQIFEHFSDSE
jgi:putative transposase